MLRKVIFSFFAIASTLGVFASSSFAQTAPVSGKVELKKADGTLTPVDGAVVEVFRTDIKSGGIEAKTDKKGQFSFAGLQGTLVISVSAVGAQPTYLPGVKPGTENLRFTLSEGDGRRLTAEEVRQAATMATSAAGGQLTEEQKKEQADFEKKKAEVESRNKRIENESAIFAASLKDGNAAFEQKNWDIAVAKYDEGFNANPTFAGSAPVFLNNKGTALRQRAIETYNKFVKSTEPTVKSEAMEKVRSDLSNSVDSYNKAWTIVKGATLEDLKDQKSKDEQILRALNGAKESLAAMVATDKVDPSKIDAAKAMMPEFIALESDVAKKAAAQNVVGDVYRVAGDFDSAIGEYRKTLEIAKDNPDALAGLGLSLMSVGSVAKDEGDRSKNKAMSDKGVEQMQESLNILNQFGQVAPDTHPLKASVKDATTYLTTDAKLTPQKAAPAKRRGN